MNTPNQNIFRSTIGYCHILPDKIAFTKDGKPESIVLNSPKEHNPIKFLLVYGMVILFIVSFTIYKYLDQKIDLTTTIIAISIISIFLYYALKMLFYQTRTYIDRDRIITIKYKPGIRSITYGRFIISYRSENGKVLYATIQMRDPRFFGNKEAEDAVNIMTDAGLIDSPKK